MNNKIPIKVIKKVQSELIKNQSASGRYRYITLDKLITILLTHDIQISTIDCSIINKTDDLNTLKLSFQITYDGEVVLKSSTETVLPKIIDIQKYGSLITYIRRYHTLMALGIHPMNEDDDGQCLLVNIESKNAVFNIKQTQVSTQPLASENHRNKK